MDRRTISGFILFMAGVVVAAGGLLMLYNEQPKLPAGPVVPRVVYAPTCDPWTIDAPHPKELKRVQLAAADVQVSP